MKEKEENIQPILLRAGLIPGGIPELEKSDAPWYVKLLLGMSGWAAALFLLSFLALGFRFIFEHSLASFLLGTAMISGALTILRMPRTEFGEQAALAMSLTGQVLVVLAIFDVINSERPALLFVAMLQALLAIVMPNFIHRIFSTFIASLLVPVVLTSWGVPYIGSGVVMLLAAWCWLNEFRSAHQMKKIQGIGYGLVLALIVLKGTALFGYQGLWWLSVQSLPSAWGGPWLGEALIGVVAVAVVLHLLHLYGQPFSSRISVLSIFGILIFSIAAFKVQGVTVGISILLLGFAGANRVLMGLGIVSLLFFISSYYCLLETNLLTKSLSLFLVGAVLIFFRLVTAAVFTDAKERKYA